MSYQVIARKYRPQRFADVVGQEHVTQTLTNAIEKKRIAHAYLFCGPRGTGKTTIARIFAKCLNATGGPKVDFDDKDFHVQEITEGRSLDVLEIDGASNNGVEQVRELRETCKYAPANSLYKIYIIDEVHMLSTAAFNALLKTLEEPPAHVKFMFATTDPEKVLPTILSRCQRFDLRRIPAALITKHLAEIAKKEKVKIDPAALHAIARGADGGMRDAESTLDQLISFCGDKIEEADVLSMFGLASESQILNLSKAVLAGDVQTALTELNQLAQGGKDLGRLLSDLLSHFRNLLIFQISRGDLNLLEVSENEVTSLKEQSASANSDSLMRILDTFTEAELHLRDAASKKIFLEVALLKAIEARNAVSIDSVLKQLNNLRGGGGGTALPASAPTHSIVSEAKPAPRVASAVSLPKENFQAAPAPAPTPAQPLVPQTAPAIVPVAASADLSALWTSLVESVRLASPFVHSYLREAHPVSFDKNLFIIGFDPEFSDKIGLIDNSRNQTMLQTKLAELGHSHTHVKFIQHERPEGYAPVAAPALTPSAPPVIAASSSATQASTPATAPARAALPAKATPFNKNDFKNDPLIQKALEIFKGQIVEVRA